MDAAIHLFAERGVLASSVEEISERAGFTRGAFYSNFASKDELVLALLARETERQIGHTRRVIDTSLATTAPSGEPRAVAEQIGESMQSFFGLQQPDGDWPVAECELRLYAIRNPAVAAELSSFLAQCRAELVELLTGALAVAGWEFSIPTERALDMLTAIYDHATLDALVAQATGTAVQQASGELMTALLNAITRRRAQS